MNYINNTFKVNLIVLEKIIFQQMNRIYHQPDEIMKDDSYAPATLPAPSIQPHFDTTSLSDPIKKAYEKATADDKNHSLHMIINTSNFELLDSNVQIAVIEEYAAASDVLSKSNVAKLVLDSTVLHGIPASLAILMLKHRALAIDIGIQNLEIGHQIWIFNKIESDLLFSKEIKDFMNTSTYKEALENLHMPSEIIARFVELYKQAEDLYKSQIRKFSLHASKSI
jgi:hypothetical protein